MSAVCSDVIRGETATRTMYVNLRQNPSAIMEVGARLVNPGARKVNYLPLMDCREADIVIMLLTC
jgi:hypothetical protein